MPKEFLRPSWWVNFAIIFGLLLLLPLVSPEFRVPLYGKYLSFAFVALGIVLSWGYCGILSLGQGIFFGIGAYSLAMFLKLEASSPELPDFMVWSNCHWLGCHSKASALPCYVYWYCPSWWHFHSPI